MSLYLKWVFKRQHIVGSYVSLLMTRSPRNFQLSQLFALSLQQFVNYSSDFPTQALVPILLVIICSSKLCLPVFTCLNLQFGGSSLPLVISHLMNLRRVTNFLVSSAFCLFLRQSGDFQTPYMQNQKSGLSNITFMQKKKKSTYASILYCVVFNILSLISLLI